LNEKIETLIVGGGQGGLSISYFLLQQNREHIILEQANQAAVAWRNRWDSFTLITPNWMIRLPGAEYQGEDPDGFMVKDKIIAYFEEYIKRFNVPIRYGFKVTSVEPIKDGYLVKSDKAKFEATNVVIATGFNQQPKFPKFYSNLSSEINSLHSSQYRNPAGLPEGAVLVVGSAQSGCQIAEELYQSGRKVFLSVSRTDRVPRRYRGKDVTWWLEEMGASDRTVDNLPSPKAKFASSIQGTGKDGGHTINLHQFARDGVILLGHIQNIDKNSIYFLPDLKENLAKADKFEADFVQQVNEYVAKKVLDVPSEELPKLRDGYKMDLIPELNTKSASITNVIWATGYKFDFSLVKLPVFDEDGYPVQKRGVTEYPGLFFIGLPFLHTVKSGLLAGVGDDAAHVVSAIANLKT